MASRSTVMLATVIGVLAGMAWASSRRSPRRRDTSVAAPEPLQVWEDEGGAVPTRSGRNAREVSPSGPAFEASSIPTLTRTPVRAGNSPPDDFPPVPSPS